MNEIVTVDTSNYLPKADRRKDGAQTVISRRKQKIFLRELRLRGRPIEAAKAAGYTDTNFLRRLYHADEDFRKSWDEAIENSADIMEDEAMRRAVQGSDEPVFYKGRIVGYMNRRSDQLLMFLLRAARPDKYSEKVDVSGTIKGTFGVAVLPMTAVSAVAWEQVAATHAAAIPSATPPELMPPMPVRQDGETADVEIVRA